MQNILVLAESSTIRRVSKSAFKSFPQYQTFRKKSNMNTRLNFRGNDLTVLLVKGNCTFLLENMYIHICNHCRNAACRILHSFWLKICKGISGKIHILEINCWILAIMCLSTTMGLWWGNNKLIGRNFQKSWQLLAYLPSQL